jgi:hypothetical protein
MLTEQAKNLKAELKLLQKNDDWLERMGSPELTFWANLHPDLTQTTKTDASGRKRTILRPEAKNKYLLYGLLRSKKRCPKNEHGETMLKQMNEEK